MILSASPSREQHLAIGAECDEGGARWFVFTKSAPHWNLLRQIKLRERKNCSIPGGSSALA